MFGKMIRRTKYFVFLSFFAGLQIASGQDKPLLVGGGISYCTFMHSPGVNINATYRLFNKFYVGPDFSAVLTREIKKDGRTVKRKELEYNFNFQRVFQFRKTLGVYPLIGINFSKLTVHPLGETASKRLIIALNAGGGLEIELGRSRLFVEAKYVSWFPKYDITSGILFSL
jgi:hypothetical protein